jgi:L-amino acid N-acyltransferase YncA
MKTEIRLVKEQDAPQILEVYAPYVKETIITFDYEVPTLEEMTEKIRSISPLYPWLACIINDKLIGYAYGSRHRAKAAYEWSPESTIYLSNEAQGKGVGRLLYETLLELLRIQGYATVFAGVGMPNEKSVGLHRAIGFKEIGDFRNIGYKSGRWVDVKWFQHDVATEVVTPYD